MIRTILSFGMGFKGAINKLHAIKLLTNDKKLITANSDLIMNGLQSVFARNLREYFENVRLTYQYGTIGQRLKSTSRSVLDNGNYLICFQARAMTPSLR